MALLDDDDEEFTELVDAKFGRVDLVQTPATGARFVIAKQGEDSRGLVPPEVIRDLIGKSEPAPEHVTDLEGPVTMTASPAAMAAFIHKAGVRQAPPVQKEPDVDTVTKDIGPDLDGDPADDGMDLTTPSPNPTPTPPVMPPTPAPPRGRPSTPPPPRNGPPSRSG